MYWVTTNHYLINDFKYFACNKFCSYNENDFNSSSAVTFLQVAKGEWQMSWSKKDHSKKYRVSQLFQDVFYIISLRVGLFQAENFKAILQISWLIYWKNNAIYMGTVFFYVRFSVLLTLELLINHWKLWNAT